MNVGYASRNNIKIINIMGRKCCVPNCSSNYDASLRKGQSTISTFKFPEVKHLRDSWLRALNRGSNWQPGRTASICINHFLPEDIMRYDKPAKLKAEAIPSIFRNLYEKDPRLKRGRPKKRETDILKTKRQEFCLSEPVVMEEIFLDFQSFGQLVNKNLTMEGWYHYQNEKVLHFYTIHEQNSDIAIEIVNSIKVYQNMEIKLFLMNVQQANENLNWVLENDMKIRRWSQFETILKKYDSKRENSKDPDAPVDDASFSAECKSFSPNLDSTMDYFDEQQDAEIEFVALENMQEQTFTPNQAAFNPQQSNNECFDTTHKLTERERVREIVRKLKSAKHKCFICQKEHESNEECERHLPEHAAMLPFNCKMCTTDAVTIKTLASLNKHFLMHEKPLKCRACDVRFSNYSTRILHEQNSHTIQGPFTCEICGKKSNSFRGLQHHFKVHTNPGSMKCKLCDKQLSSRYELKLHMRVHTKEKPNKCPFCQASFNRISNLVVHKRRIHGTEKPFRCESCGDEFRSGIELKRHSTRYHGITAPVISIHKSISKHVSPSEDSKKVYPCKICDIDLKNVIIYHSHMRKHRKRYQCSYCGLQIGQFKDFIDHENTHTGNRPYKCEICLKTFKTSSTYYGHKTIHRAEKRFCCDVCGRKFNRLRHMVIHTNTHNKKSL